MVGATGCVKVIVRNFEFGGRVLLGYARVELGMWGRRSVAGGALAVGL